MKVAILGTAPSTRLLAPFQDGSWQIWACSPGNKDLPDIHLFFQLHALELILADQRGRDHLAWMANGKFAVFMQAENPHVPQAKAFPKDELVAEFGPYWFTSSIAWMMAYAITQGAEEIALYGVDMAHSSEYALQKPGCIWFIEEARSRGIKISVPPGSDLLAPPPLYGYSEATPKGAKLHIRRREIGQRTAEIRSEMAELQQELQQRQKKIDYFTGAEEQLNYEYLQSWECFDPEFPRRPAAVSLGERQELPQRGNATFYGSEVLRPEPSGPWEHPCA
jgi:hypothetical protein